ncbi:MAG: glutamate 5-kinase, partial [Ruminococcus sp.]|nr:glutamate 5-kinase [Ruminococcus sp.]
CELMYLYDKLFAEYSINVAQLLLTKFVLIEDRRQNVQNALERVIQLGAIPLVNENDTVAIDELELEVGENDSLAATVAKIANADLLIIMSDIDGLYDADPRLDPDAKLIPVVEDLTDDIRKLAGGAGTKMGTGGMITKINADEIAVNNGIDMIILNGKNPDNLYYLFETGSLGTRFKAKGSPAEKKEPAIDESSDSDIVEDQ